MLSLLYLLRDTRSANRTCPTGCWPRGVLAARAYSGPVLLGGLRRISQVMVDKITTVPRAKIGARMGRVDAATMQAIRQAVVGFLRL